MSALTLSMACFCVVAVVSGASPETYTTKFDNVNVDQILKNERLLMSYFNCIMGRGKCTPDGEELKRHIPEALETGCVKCSERQRSGTEKVMKFLITKRPKLYQEVEKEYDPKGLYRERYRAEAEAAGISV